MSSSTCEIRRLLSAYRFWGLAAVAFFALFLLSVLSLVSTAGINYLLIASPLFFGFLWIGTTSLSRHALVQLKQSIGKEVSLLEFVSTQFVFALFPIIYRELKKEVALYNNPSR